MNIFKKIKEDFCNVGRNDPALHSKFELFFNYPGLWALFYHRIAHWLYNKGLRFLPRFISGFSRIITTVDIHPAAQIGERVFIDHGAGVVIGETTIIGNDVVIYQQVTLGGVSTSAGKRHPTVEDKVVIGAGAKVLGNITLHKGCKVGANSVVVKDVPKCATAVGVPARIINCERDNDPLSHNILPDVNKEIFHYLIKRIAVLEETIKTGDTKLIDKEDHELEEVYATFIKSM
ncbi:MAG TPA: serine O-acetyltransferase [Campylobacterales bacterium]|nr:serine O-acetyltransferase [Campylobacterales bacterium]HHS91987.1 serine O-acetyltransferase [Campylobacterales bacterium]